MHSEINTRSKATLAAASTGSDETDHLLRSTIKRIDKAAAKGVIHKNTAARQKSRLIKQVREQTGTAAAKS